MLSPEDIKTFKEIYLKNFGVQLEDEEASLRANNLFSLYEAVYGDWASKHNKNDERKTNG